MQRINQLIHGENPDFWSVLTIHLFGLGATFIWLILINTTPTELTWWKQLIIASIIYDLMGGIIANATQSTNQKYRKQSYFRQLLFLVAHLFQPLVLAFLIDGGNQLNYLYLYLFMLGSGAIVLLLQKTKVQISIALALFISGVLILPWNESKIPGLDSFVAVYLLKLIVAFSVDFYGNHQINKNQ